MRKAIFKRNTTDRQCAGLVASIGSPRRLEICNEFGRKLPRRRFKYDHESKPHGERFDRAERIAADPALSRWLTAVGAA